MDKLVVTRRGDKVCTAVVSDGKVSQLMLEPDTADSLLGNIYIGKVQKVVSNINAAFIDIGPGCTGYYSLQERWKPERLKTGDELVVQVSKDAVKSKAPVVTERLSFTGRYCVLTVGKTGIGFSAKIRDASYKARLRELLECDLAGTKNLGIIVRTNAVTVEKCAVREELAELMRTWQRLSAEAGCRVCYSCLYRALPGYIAAIRDSFGGTLEEIITDIPEYHRELKAYLEMCQREDAGRLTLYEDSLLPLGKLYSLETAFEKALGKNVWLKSGGYLVIEPTEAMTVIDVNTGVLRQEKDAGHHIQDKYGGCG